LDVEPPSRFGTAGRSSGAEGATDEQSVRELDRVPPPGFEPVLLASVRKKAAKQSDSTKDGRRRFGLTLGRSGPERPEPTSSPADAPEALAQTAPAPMTPVREEPAEVAEQPQVVLPVEDVIAAALAARPAPAPAPPVHREPAVSAPPVEPVVPEPEPEPVVPEPKPEPVVPEPEPRPVVEGSA